MEEIVEIGLLRVFFKSESNAAPSQHERYHVLMENLIGKYVNGQTWVHALYATKTLESQLFDVGLGDPSSVG